jgi:hypothetical protein
VTAVAETDAVTPLAERRVSVGFHAVPAQEIPEVDEVAIHALGLSPLQRDRQRRRVAVLTEILLVALRAGVRSRSGIAAVIVKEVSLMGEVRDWAKGEMRQIHVTSLAGSGGVFLMVRVAA